MCINRRLLDLDIRPNACWFRRPPRQSSNDLDLDRVDSRKQVAVVHWLHLIQFHLRSRRYPVVIARHEGPAWPLQQAG